jgi:PadR family transcriptional regulator PadR
VSSARSPALLGVASCPGPGALTNRILLPDGRKLRTLRETIRRRGTVPKTLLTNRYPYVEFTNMGKDEPRLTQQTLKVLGTFMSSNTRELSGAEIAKFSQLSSGTLYPILYRLDEFGWLDSRWEKGDPATLGRPRRRYYRITAEGAKRVQEVVRELSPGTARLAWNT